MPSTSLSSLTTSIAQRRAPLATCEVDDLAEQPRHSRSVSAPPGPCALERRKRDGAKFVFGFDFASHQPSDRQIGKAVEMLLSGGDYQGRLTPSIREALGRRLRSDLRGLADQEQALPRSARHTGPWTVELGYKVRLPVDQPLATSGKAFPARYSLNSLVMRFTREPADRSFGLEITRLPRAETHVAARNACVVRTPDVT